MGVTGDHKDDMAFFHYLVIGALVKIQDGLVRESEIRARGEKSFEADGTVYRAIERAWLE